MIGDKMSKVKRLICGVGFNDAGYTSHKSLYYTKWYGMIRRCYSKESETKNPTYKDCYVCDEWLTFSNFKAWMEQQDYEDKHLDKDLLVCNNKVYSPETCVFVPREINQFLTKSNNSRGKYPLGVSFMVKQKDRPSLRAKPFISMISKGGVSNFLGYYETPEEAHRAWQEAKIDQALEYYNEINSTKIKEGLLRVANKIQHDYDNSLITEYF